MKSLFPVTALIASVALLTGCSPAPTIDATVSPGAVVVLETNRAGTGWSVNHLDLPDQPSAGAPSPVVVREGGISTLVVPIGTRVGSYTVILGGTPDFDPNAEALVYRVEVR